MTKLEFLTVIFGVLFLFWILIVAGEWLTSVIKLFDYGKLRKFFKRL